MQCRLADSKNKHFSSCPDRLWIRKAEERVEREGSEKEKGEEVVEGEGE